MKTTISEWLEAQTGESRRQMALRLGQTPSTFNRNIDTAEVIVAVCRSYGLNPVEGLIVARLVTLQEVRDAVGPLTLSDIEEKKLLEEVLRRATDRDESVLVQPLALDSDGLPNYEEMSGADAMNYGLAAQGEDKDIGHDDVPDAT